VGESEAAILNRDFHAERTDCRQSLDGFIGDPGFPLDQGAAHRDVAEVPQPGTELLAAAGGLLGGTRMRADQAELEVAEEELPAEAGQRPLRLPGLLGDLTGLRLGDLDASVGFLVIAHGASRFARLPGALMRPSSVSSSSAGRGLGIWLLPGTGRW
jgi:hypothetical protein